MEAKDKTSTWICVWNGRDRLDIKFIVIQLCFPPCDDDRSIVYIDILHAQIIANACKLHFVAETKVRLVIEREREISWLCIHTCVQE